MTRNLIKGRSLSLVSVIIGCVVFNGALLAATEKGWFGMVVNVTAESMFSFNPTLKTVTISKVEPGSPAATGGLAVNDQVIEVEGITIAGRKAKDVETVMQKKPGETLHLRLKHASGQLYSATLVAVAKPKA